MVAVVVVAAMVAAVMVGGFSWTLEFGTLDRDDDDEIHFPTM